MATLTNSPTVSNEPWGNYAEADYDLAQWHNACLIHQHVGPPSSKAQCKLAVKTPNGILNRNGVFAAAGALAGARTPLQASPAEKEKARVALLGLYNKIGAKPPPSIQHSDIIEHHGVLGMKWGVHRRVGGSTGAVSRNPIRGYTRMKVASQKRQAQKPPESPDVKLVNELKKKPLRSLSNQELRTVNERKNLEQQYTKLNPSKVESGRQIARKVLEAGGMAMAFYGMVSSPLGKKLMNIGKKETYKQLKFDFKA